MRKLRDAARPEFIETVLHHGYRLIAPVSVLCSRKERPRVVVLPFEDLNGADGCFSKAVTEALITQLGRKCKQLDVIAPPPITHDKNPLELRQELCSDYLLSGSLQHSKEQVRVTARLVRNEDRCCLWCDSYTRAHPRSLLVQDEVAGSIAQNVCAPFLRERVERLGGRGRSKRKRTPFGARFRYIRLHSLGVAPYTFRSKNTTSP